MGAPRRAELGSHGNGGRGALGVRVEGCNALNRKGRRGRASWDAAAWGRHGQGRRRRGGGLRDAVGGVSRRGVGGGACLSPVQPEGMARGQTVGARGRFGSGCDAWAARWRRRRTA